MPSERLAPDAILSQTNLSGAVTAIQDDPDSPDASWLTAPGNNNDTEVYCSFPSPSAALAAGVNAQNLRVWVRKTNHPTDPTVRIELWENGSLVRAGSDVAVSSVTGEIKFLLWGENELAGDGSAVEVKVIGTTGGGNPGNRASLEVGAIEWNAETQTADRTGTADQSVAAFSSSASGSQTDEGVGDQVVPAFTTAALAAQVDDGSIDQVLAGFTTAAAGQVSFVGSIDQALAPFAQGAVAHQANAGLLDQVVAAFTQAAAGTVELTSVTGALDQAMPAVTSSAVGSQNFRALATSSAAPFEQAASGEIAFVGSIDQELAAFTQQAGGGQIFAATLDQAAPAFETSGSGTVETIGVTGTADHGLAAFTSSGFAELVFRGQADTSLAAFATALEGGQVLAGAGVHQIAAFAQAATGEVSFVGSIDELLAAFTQQASGAATERSGSIDLSLPAFLQDASGLAGATLAPSSESIVRLPKRPLMVAVETRPSMTKAVE